MKPSNKVTKAPVIRVSEGDVNEWVNFLAYLPITQKIWTTVLIQEKNRNGCVEDESESDRKRGNKFNVHLALEPEYNDFDLIPMVSAWYNTDNKACIRDHSFSSTPLTDELGARTDIFGFEGTWEEVTLKLVELNNLVFNSTPKMGDVVKKAEVLK